MSRTKKELLSLFEDKAIPEDVRQEAIDRVKNSPDGEAQGKSVKYFLAVLAA